VAIGDDIVVLDARTSAYFCLAAASGSVRTGPAGIAFDDPELADQFAEAGLLASAPPPPSPAPSPSPRHDFRSEAAGSVRIGDLSVILAAWLTMFVSYHLVDFNGLISQERRRDPVSDAGAPTEDIRRLVAAFERVLPWLPFQAVCLYRALLLKRVLRWRGAGARLVFGVRTWPFQAHCWLQIGDTVLDDAAERLNGFFPIMEV
jgi:hypothetical protein